MRRLKVLGSLMLSLALMMSVFVTGAGAGVDEQVRVLVKANGADKAELQSKYGVRHDFNELGFTTNMSQAQFDALQNAKGLEVSLVNKYSITAKPGSGRALPSDQTPWGMEAIYGDASITATSGGDNIRVAVLDTGVMTDHVDITGNVEQCKDFAQNRADIVDGTCEDKNGHGTHVAGTVLANGGADGQGIYGVAPTAKLWAYRVLGNSGFGYGDDIARAIETATDQANSLGVNVVISMSLGSSSKDTLISNAVTYARNNGVLVVAAAGNSGPNAGTIGYPGGLVDAVAVAALEDVQENGTYRVADFSSRGIAGQAGDYSIQEGDVEISAPGKYIESTWNDGAYNTISGTSMATPHVSGLAAKIWAANASWSAEQVRSELQSRATANDILGGIHAGPGDDIASGFGFATVQ